MSVTIHKKSGSYADDWEFDGKNLHKKSKSYSEDWIFDGSAMHKKSGSYADDWVTDGYVPIVVLAVAVGIIDQNFYSAFQNANSITVKTAYLTILKISI